MFGVPDNAPTPKEPTLDEINLKIPRHVRPSDDGRSSLWLMLISLGIGLAILGGLSYYLVHQWQQHNALEREGLEASARVTRIISGRHNNYVHYIFQVGGADYRNEVTWLHGPYRLSGGSEITILYLPSDPSINYPKGWGWLDSGILFLFYFGALPIYLGAQTAWNLLRDHRLARHGLVTEGKVTLCVPKKNTGNFMVDYEFRTQPDYHAQNDQLIEGSNNNCPDEYKTDAKIKVIYLPSHPSRNNSWPLQSFEMVERKPQPGLLMANR